jgi:CubicO group peptidase (beta-lactamase class C family)
MSNLDADMSRLDSFIKAHMEAARTPGLAIGFFDRQRILRVATYGYADLEAQIPVAPETLFEIGSITKTFTAVAVLQAVEKGLVKLDGLVTDYLPWFAVQKYEPITIHHLLTHTAGLIGVIDKTPDIRSAVLALRDTELGWTPGSRFAYSDAGYQILTLILEEVTGQPFAEIIRRNIFEPLGMTASVGALTHAIRPRLAKGYRYLYDDRPAHAGQPLFPVTWMEVSSGDCSIASTAEDMARFGRMLLNRGQGVDSQLLAPASYAAMVQLHSSAGWCDYSYGIMLRTVDNFAHIGHGGGMPGYVAELIIDVNNGIGLALLSSEPRSTELFWKVMTLWRKRYLGQPLAPVDLSVPDPLVVKNAADYVGIYRNHEKTLTVTTRGDQLQLNHEGQAIVLECRGSDCFYSHHPDFDRFLLHFGRNEGMPGAPGEVVEAMHGADWYVKDSYNGQRTFEIPEAWQLYPGHYRAHNPWQTNFRVILRKGRLLLVEPGGDEALLFPIREHEFCVGDEAAPERICFSQIVGGHALCATRSGCEYYRFFTP